MRSLPRIVSGIPNDVRNFLDRVREYLGEGGEGRFVTLKELRAGGIVGTTPNGTITPPPVFGVENPNQPTGLTTSGAIGVILLTWDAPQYRGHSHTEIWSASTDDFAAKTLVGRSDGTIFSDAVGSGASRYYWIRFVNVLDTEGPFNGLPGTVGIAGTDPAYLLDVLDGAITESQLYTTLNERIDLIDGSATTPGTIPYQLSLLQGQIDDLNATPAYDNATTYATGDIVQYSGGLYQATQATTGNLPTNTTYWIKIGDYTSLGDAVATHTTEIATLTTDLGAETTARELLATQMRGSYTGTDIALVTSGLIYSERQARATADSSEVSAREALAAQVRGSYDGTDLSLVTSGLIYSERTARASADSALASDITTLATTVGDNTAAIEANASSIDGVKALYTIKIDNNGFVSGFGLISDFTGGGTPTSRFYVNVDQFAVTTPASSLPSWASATSYAVGAFVKVTNDSSRMLVCRVAGTSGGTEPSVSALTLGALVTDNTAVWQVASRVPLSVLTTPQTINGISVPAGVYIDGGSIVNGTITNASIANLAVNDAKIDTVSVNKLTTGSLQVGAVISSTSYSAGVSGWQIRADGTAEFAQAVIRGSIYGASATTYTTGTGLFAGFDTLTITSLTRSASTATATTSVAHGLVVGNTVTISGVTNDTGWNGTYTVSSIVSATQFRFTVSSTRVTPATGTAIRATSPYRFRVGNPSGNQIAWNGSTLTITGALSGGSISGTSITGSSLQVGTAQTSGTTMTGAGAIFYSNGVFSLGNATTNATFDGSALYLNGQVVGAANMPPRAVNRAEVVSQGLSSATTLPTVRLFDIAQGSTATVATVSITPDIAISGTNGNFIVVTMSLLFDRSSDSADRGIITVSRSYTGGTTVDLPYHPIYTINTGYMSTTQFVIDELSGVTIPADTTITYNIRIYAQASRSYLMAYQVMAELKQR